MEVLIFLVVIVLLIVVHELGHLFVAKWSGMRVDEFGIGYPPRAALLGKIGETEITLNWLPFGGFVKIYGEDATPDQAPDRRAFNTKNRFLQALVLLAGVAMNVVLAFVLLAGALAVGTPRALSDSDLVHAKNIQLVIGSVLPSSPAALAGIIPGDIVVSATDAKGEWIQSQAADVTTFTDYIAASGGEPIALSIDRNSTARAITASAKQGVVDTAPSRYALGLSVAPIGVLPLSFSQSIVQGAELTYGVAIETAKGFWQLIRGAFTLSADLSQVSGPIGIARAVGNAAHQGFGDLLSFAGLISINLAFVNLIPIPALDGGRLLFVIIESITRRPIKRSIANTINSISFALLILLMIVVSIHDIYR